MHHLSQSQPRAASIVFAVLLLHLLPAIVFGQNSRHVELLGHLAYPSGNSDIWGYADNNGKEYAIMGVRDGTAIVDVTDPSQPQQVAHISGPPAPPFEWRDFKTHSHYLYVTSEGIGARQGLQVIDLSDPPNARLAAIFDSTFVTAHNLYIDSGYAYVVGTSGSVFGFHVLDLRNPEHPVAVGSYNRKYIHDIYVRDNVAYASAINDGSLEILDVSNKTNITTLASIRSPNNSVHSAWLTDDGSYVLTTDETNGGHLLIWDIRDLSNVELVGEYESGRNISIHNVHVRDGFAHVSYYLEGYRLVDISDVTRPVEAGYFDTFLPSISPKGLYDGAWGVYPYAPSGHIYVSDIASGLYVFRISDNWGTGTITGTVVDSNTGVPIPGAEMHLIEASKHFESDANGAFSFGIWDGHHSITATARGYFADTVEVDLMSGAQTTTTLRLPANTAAIGASIDSVAIELEVGTFSRQSFNVTNTGGGVLEFSIRDAAGVDTLADVSWLRENPTTGTLLAGQSQGITLDIVAIRLVPDTVYVGYILIEATNLIRDPVIIPVRLTTVSPTAVAERDEAHLDKFALYENYPNPFNPKTKIEFQIPVRAHAVLKVYDLHGREVRTLVDAILQPGRHEGSWDGHDNFGNPVASGVYLYRLRAGGISLIRKMSLLQ